MKHEQIVKKVIVILPNGRGGAERQLVRISSFLPDNNFSVVYAVVGASMDKVATVIPEGAAVRFVRLSHIWQGGIFRLYRLFKKEKPYAIFSSFHYLNGRCILAARMAGVSKTVIRGNMSASDGDFFARILMRLYYRKASFYICQTDEMRDEALKVLKVAPGKAVVLHNPLDTEQLDKRASEGPYPFGAGVHLVCAARICPHKGQDVLLRAFVPFLKNHPDAHLHILGDVHNADSFYKDLQDFIVSSHLEGHVHFEGFQTNPWRWIAYAACVVLPSYVEGLPNVLIEAQYFGVPCAATLSVPSISAIVRDGVNGYTVAPGDPQALSEAMEKALNLDDVPFTYVPAPKEEFVHLFE